MKNKFFYIVICAFCIATVFCLCANALAPELLPDENAKFTVNYEGESGELYFLLVLDGTYHEGEERVLTQDSILYISQTRADNNGLASFSSFRPKPCESATVFVSGGSLDAPEICGYINTVSKCTITVPENSTVHFADGTTRKYENKSTVFVPAKKGFMYVNSGYTSHVLYSVDSNGVPEQITGLDNAVVGINGASMRIQDPQGLRFYSYASKSAKELDASDDGYEITEYGLIVTAETAYTGLLGADYTLDMNLVSEGKAVHGVAYGKDGFDRIFEDQDDYNRVIFTAVLLNIPETKTGYTTVLASRPYYIVSDGEKKTVLYGEITKRSVYEVASLIKNENGDSYYENMEYIDSIIAIAEQ